MSTPDFQLPTPDAQHSVYLAVPGVQFCWGTFIGVLNATSRHVVHPYNGGGGFSCVFDFNVLWADALNRFEAGEITHFAMLHGDIVPDVQQRWLDILLEEMDARDAELVSAPSPIKDDRGVTSTGICDLADTWRPWRRFTMRELCEQLPETFDHVAAGYPDRPLLHNTCCWVCDLRKPVFRETNSDGSLKMLFRFPERIVRDGAGHWLKQAESEDWVLSRELWERGAKNTWITRRVRLQHRGMHEWPNDRAYGRYKDGDEDTRDKWGAAVDALPLRLVQLLNFELSPKCNLGRKHTECPNQHPGRFAGLSTAARLDDDTIVRSAVAAYRDLGFSGLVGWAYYNEPLLEADRMFRLMDRIKAEVPQARFILWTNGTLIPADCAAYRQFAQIVVSGYDDVPESRRGFERLAALNIPCDFRPHAGLDNRLVQITPADPAAACLRPFVEFPIDCYGNVHLCCYDWRGGGTPGNILLEGLPLVARRWRDGLSAIAGPAMTQEAPATCRTCGHRWDRYQQHDAAIVARAERWRGQLATSA
jgi:hypothetical protein